MKLILDKNASFPPFNRGEMVGHEFETSEEDGKALVAAGLAHEVTAPVTEEKPKGDAKK